MTSASRVYPQSSQSYTGTRGIAPVVRERQILDAALHEFAVLGYAAATMSAIAERAEVSKPLIYRYCGTKDHLFAACVDHIGNTLLAAVERAIDTRPGENVVLPTMISVTDVLAAGPGRWNLLFDRSVPAGTRAHSAVLEMTGRLVATLSEVLPVVREPGDRAPAMDGSLAASMWISLVTALMNWWCAHPGHRPDQVALIAEQSLNSLVQPRISGS
ncbi:TetR/AcrR family transcriptional regulator [Nocardia sp. NPDC004085]